MKNQDKNNTSRFPSSFNNGIQKQGNRTSISFKKNDDISMNKEYIVQMKHENQRLKEELEVEARKNQLTDVNTSVKMEQLQDQSAIYARKIEIESQKMKDLESLIQIAEQQLLETKKKMNASDGVELPHLQKKQKTLEAQLAQIKQKHNESLADINMMKEQINLARRERVIYSNVFKKLESDIRQKEEEFKKQLLIRKQVETELKEREDQFYKMKNQAEDSLKRCQKDYENAFNQNQSGEDMILENDFKQVSFVLQNIENGNKEISKQKFNRGESTILMLESIDEVGQYEFMFEKLKKQTSFTDIEDLIILFKNIEEINSDLFQKINKLNDEIDDYEHQIIDVRLEIKLYQKPSLEGEVQNKDHEALKLEYELQVERNREIDISVEQIRAEILRFSEELLKIADKTGLEPRLFITDGEINEWNTQVLLQKVEERSNQLIDLCKFFDNQNLNVENQEL